MNRWKSVPIFWGKNVLQGKREFIINNGRQFSVKEFISYLEYRKGL